MIDKNTIAEYIYTSKLINEVLINVISEQYIDDFKSHFILQVYNIKDEKLQMLIDKNCIDYYCLKIITNQWYNRSSTFWQTYIHNSIDYSYEKNISEEEYTEEVYNKQMNMINKLLDKQYDTLIINQYYKTLFELYYFKGLKLKEIEKLTQINLKTVHRAISKTKKYIEEKIKETK